MKDLVIQCKEYIAQGGESIIKRAPRRMPRLAEIDLGEVELYMLENKDASFN